MAKIGGLLHVVDCGGKGAGAGVRELDETIGRFAQLYRLGGRIVQFTSP